MDNFEYLVSLSLPVIDFMAAHNYLSTIGSALTIFTSWFIFQYHFSKVSSVEYFHEHPDVAIRFSKPTYEMFQFIAMALMPCAIFVFIFSVATRFNTEQFLSTFSVKGRLNPFARYKRRKRIKIATIKKRK